MVGSALIRALEAEGGWDILAPSREELNLLDQRHTQSYIHATTPDVVIVAAARVGGIHANSAYPAQFLYENLMIGANVIHASHLADIDRLLFLGSTCIYPKLAPQPIPEAALMTGPLEPTNESYALAKIAGVRLCQTYRRQYGRDYIAAMPTNLYGPGDNYHSENSHVLPALVRRFHEAKEEVVVWGTGTARREFLYVDDLAEACLFLLEHYHGAEPINVGCEEEVQIAELAHLVGETVGFEGKITFDPSKPDGTPRKKSNTSRLTSLGWKAKTSLREGLGRTFNDYLQNLCALREV